MLVRPCSQITSTSKEGQIPVVSIGMIGILESVGELEISASKVVAKSGNHSIHRAHLQRFPGFFCA